MSLLKGKLARTAAAGFSAAALVVALVAPGTVLGQSITLHRCDRADDPTCLSNVQVAVPIAAQVATQTSTIDPSAESHQTSSSTQSTDNAARAFAVNALHQAQTNTQSGGEQSIALDNTPSLTSDASVEVQGGDTTAVGPKANVTFNLTQNSDASIHGSATATTNSGDAGGDATASGDITATAGNANGHATANGGNGNGNAKAVDVAAQIRSGNSRASTDATAGDGGAAISSSGGATLSGGAGVDGGAATDNSSAANPTTHNMAGNASSTSSGANGNAVADGRGGTGGNANGNGNMAMVGGGNIAGQNRTDALLTGGMSFNALTVNFNQTGNASATGGDVTNGGSATSTPTLTSNPTATNTTTQDQHPTLTGMTGNNSQTQDASSRLRAANDQDAVNRALGRITPTAGGGGTQSATSGTQTTGPQTANP
jgi:hypothetical protein